jgi:hypothetical protein
MAQPSLLIDQLGSQPELCFHEYEQNGPERGATGQLLFKKVVRFMREYKSSTTVLEQVGQCQEY